MKNLSRCGDGTSGDEDTAPAKGETNRTEEDVENQRYLANGGEQGTCCRCSPYPYGECNTLLALTLALVALATSLLAKRSTSFTTLSHSLAPPEGFYPSYTLGLYRLKLCPEDTNNVTVLSMPSTNPFFGAFQQMDFPFVESDESCEIVRLNTAEVSDLSWNISRFAGALSILCGMLVLSWIALSCCNDGVNIRAVAVAGLLTYFFESRK